MSTGYPDGQKITQWIGAPIAQAVAAPIGAGQIVIGPTRLSSWASVIVAAKPTGGQVTITVTQTIPNGPAGLVLSQQVVVPAGATVFESFVLFGANVTITLQGAVGGTTVDYAITPSNTTTNAQVLTSATINLQRNEVLVAAEPTLDFVDGGGLTWSLTDDAPNTRVKVQAAIAAARTNGLLIVTNTAALTTIFSQVIPAGAMGANGRLRVRVLARLANLTGAPQTVRLVIALGATTIYDGTTQIGLENAAIGRPFPIEFDIVNLGVTNSQFMGGMVGIGDYNVAPVAGEGSMQGAESNVNTLARVHPIGANAGALPAVDTTAAQTLAVSVQLGVASASLELRRFFGQAEIF